MLGASMEPAKLRNQRLHDEGNRKDPIMSYSYRTISLEMLAQKLAASRVVNDTRINMDRLQCRLPCNNRMIEVGVMDGNSMTVCLCDLVKTRMSPAKRVSTVILAEETRWIDDPRDSLEFVTRFLNRHLPRNRK